MDWSDRIGRRLKPRDLHVLLAIAETGSMAKAATLLACSRPVVSRTVADLEAMLGVTLLDRTAHGVEPTSYGKALLSRSRAVFDELRKSVKEIEFLSDPGAGEVRFGCIEPLMAGIGAAAISRLSSQYPRLVFHTQTGNADVQVQLLRSRTCEVSISRRRTGLPEQDMEEEELFSEPLRIVAPIDSPWIKRRRLAISDLYDERWILAPHEAEPGSPLFEGFRAAGLGVPPATIFSYSLSLRYSLLAAGSFITAVPGSAIEFGPMRKFLAVLPVELSMWSRPVVLMTLKDRSRTPATEALMSCVRDLSQKMRT